MIEVFCPRGLLARIANHCLGLLLLCICADIQADHYEVSFGSDGDQPIVIGQLYVDALGEANGYRFELNDALFSDHFLSMRPFKCITHRERMLCYLPYPYEIRRHISREDLTDLEYDLLFIARTPSEYGIDPWNGRYFRLRWEGDRMLGELHETDLNVLAAPPEDGDLRPLAGVDILPVAESDTQWTPRLLIQPK